MGPSRVWLPDAWVPGLAMSRALGDGMARRLGLTLPKHIICHPAHACDVMRDQLLSSQGRIRVRYRSTALSALFEAYIWLRRVGVISEAEVCLVDLEEGDQFLILASDGVWEFVSNQEAVDTVSGCSDDEVACSKVTTATFSILLTCITGARFMNAQLWSIESSIPLCGSCSWWLQHTKSGWSRRTAVLMTLQQL